MTLNNGTSYAYGNISYTKKKLTHHSAQAIAGKINSQWRQSYAIIAHPTIVRIMINMTFTYHNHSIQYFDETKHVIQE